MVQARLAGWKRPIPVGFNLSSEILVVQANHQEGICQDCRTFQSLKRDFGGSSLSQAERLVSRYGFNLSSEILVVQAWRICGLASLNPFKFQSLKRDFGGSSEELVRRLEEML